MASLLRPPHAPASPGIGRALSSRGRSLLLCCLALAAGVSALQAKTLGRAFIGGLGLLVLVLIILSGRDLALTMVIGWLVLLGFVRRLLIPFAGWSPQDPLLLISPIAAIVLWQSAPRDGPALRRTVLSSLVVFLMLMVGAQILNPSEPSVRLALQGSLYYLTPLLWFFVGRTLNTRQHERLLSTLFWMNLPVLGLGLYHTFVGFLPFELHWLAVGGPGAAIFLPGFRIRPFSTLVSPQEYGIYLLFSSVIILARILYVRRHRGWLSGLLALTLFTLFLQSSRGTLVGAAIAIVLLPLVKTRSVKLFLAMVGAALAMLLLFPHPSLPTGGSLAVAAANSQMNQQAAAHGSGGRTGSVQVLVQHQLDGILNPSGSTAPIHIDLVITRVRDGIKHPFGLGVSTGSIAASKADSVNKLSGETDIANTTAGLGIFGGLALLILVFVGLGAAVRMQRLEPSPRHLAWLGILVAGITQWLNGGLYVASTITFLILGGLAREISQRRSRLAVDTSRPGG